VIPDEDDTAEQREAHGQKDPIRELPPVETLHRVEVARVEQLPRPENVHFVSPDRADVRKGKREIEEKKDFRIQNQPP